MYNLQQRYDPGALDATQKGCAPVSSGDPHVGCRQWALTIPTLLVLVVVYSYWAYERWVTWGSPDNCTPAAGWLQRWVSMTVLSDLAAELVLHTVSQPAQQVLRDACMPSGLHWSCCWHG